MLKKLSVYALALTLFAIPAKSKSWEETIFQVESKADSLWEKGRKLGADTFLGTAVNEIDVPRHQCAILGRMLGMEEIIRSLEESPEPKLSLNPTTDELYLLMLHSLSLSNWALVAQSILGESDTERRQMWNLNCVGAMDIPQSSYLEINEPSASLRVNGSDLMILGDIEVGFSLELEGALKDNPSISRIVLGSGGGNVIEALKAGFIIRERRLDTTLRANYFSACPIVFLAGVNRTIWSPYPKLGFHQMSDRDGRPINGSDPLYSIMEDYFKYMGADPSFVLASMRRAAPSEMF